jgi:hypothetical protein
MEVDWYIKSPTSKEVGKRDIIGHLGRLMLRWYTALAELAETAATF